MNLASEERAGEIKGREALAAKISRYRGLKGVAEELNQSLELDYLAQHLTRIAFSLVAGNKGACLLYLVDSRANQISLFKAQRQGAGGVIKEKEGDIFDAWVLRHASPLLVENTSRDFRFDAGKLSLRQEREISSLISAPLVSRQRISGILRLDNPQPGFFAQDDLRFLVKICELGAAALENSRLYARTQDLASHDELTGLHTKDYCLERMARECRSAGRHKGTLSLLLVDIDNFKAYNDRFGHTAGDILLKAVSRLIRDSFQGEGVLTSRFGGEEFCILLGGVGRDAAFGLAQRLREKIAQEKVILRRQETAVTASIGVAGLPADAAEADELIQKADKAMYQAKEKGRNQVCLA